MLRHLHTRRGASPRIAACANTWTRFLRVRSLSAPEQEEIRERAWGQPATRQEICKRVSARCLRDLSHLARPPVVQRAAARSRHAGGRTSVRAPGATTSAAGVNRFAQRSRIQIQPIPSMRSLSAQAISTASTTILNGLVSGLTLDQMRARLVREIEKERESSARDPVLAQALKLAWPLLLRPSPEATFCSTGSPISLSAAADLDRLAGFCARWKRRTRS